MVGYHCTGLSNDIMIEFGSDGIHALLTILKLRKWPQQLN
jgi:hypothetical protein